MAGDIQGNFNSLPWPVQRMLMQRMAAQQQARQKAGGTLYDMFPQQQQGPVTARDLGEYGSQQQPVMPAPPPGSMSPGGGNPAAAGAMAPPQVQPQMQPRPGMVAPPPVAGPQGAPPQAAAPAQQPAPQPRPQPQIAPFRPLPTAPAAGGAAPQPGSISTPPPQDQSPQPPQHVDIREVVKRLRDAGVPPDQVVDRLDAMMPILQQAQAQELNYFKTLTAAQAQAIKAFQVTMQAGLGQQRVDIRRDAEGRKKTEGEEKTKISKQKLAQQAGGMGNIAKWEFDPSDTTKVIGGWTRSGLHIKLDEPGTAVPGKAAGAGGQQAATRKNLVIGAANNALNRLNEIDQKYPKDTVSLLLQSHGEGLLEAGGESLYRRTLTTREQKVDQVWRNLITEAIPVLTGGLRGSDAFRRFLIQEAPLRGTNPEAIVEYRRLLRSNIEGMKNVFEGKPAGTDISMARDAMQKFAADPKMWGPGVTKEQVDAALEAINAATGNGAAAPQQPQTGGWKVEKVK